MQYPQLGGYSYQNRPGKTVEEYPNSNGLTLHYDPGDTKNLFLIQGVQQTLIW
jgi:hypothetical protein